VFLAYIDDSKDSGRACFSAIVLPASQWLAAERLILDYRLRLKMSDGIVVTKEFHGTDFIAGRGDLGAIVSKWRRARIFEEALTFVTTLPSVSVLNACVPRKLEDRAFERLADRLNVFAAKSGSYIMLISDEGKDFTPLIRRMRRSNYVASAHGSWAGGAALKNKPVDRIVEDIVYRDSKHSTFIQLADFCAFSLLRFESPTAKIVASGLDAAFRRLDPVIVKQAFSKDPKGLGIIRET
jgi:Protein of unknown function (DUF3800)